MYTKYDHLSDEEFLRVCFDKRHQSPIISELCRRLEEFIDLENPVTDEIKLECKNEFNCPTCEAKFSVEFESTSDEIKVNFLI